jgi:hypothetical protein
MRFVGKGPGFILCVTSFIVAACFGQNGGRFDALQNLAEDYLKNGQFDRAAGKLEEVWEQEKTDPVVAEKLAMAYLNGDDRRYRKEVFVKARVLQERAIALGGRATFLVRHSHGRISSGLNYCGGKLSISPGKVVYVPQPVQGVEEHPFEIGSTTEKLDVTDADTSGEFKIKTKGKNFTLKPRNGLKEDSDNIVALIRQHMSMK